MARFQDGWRIQKRVISALMIRELTTRFGRENIGFLWVMAEPLMFGGLVSIMWRFVKGPSEHGIGIFAFVVSGYLPLTLFRHVVSRSVSVFLANGSLMYHRQIRVLDFIIVRFVIEFLGGMMAYLFIGVLLFAFGLFPVPYSMGALIGGWMVYCLFVLSLAFVIAPLSEMSEVLEKIVPVTTYIMIPVSGTFNMVEWLTPSARPYLALSPLVSGVELMRYGLFGELVTPYYNLPVAFGATIVLTVIGLALCRKVRKNLVIE
jgi:capsular polysaccharide transport system permease protein